MTNDAIVSVWDIITPHTVCGQYPSEKRFMLITYKERKKKYRPYPSFTTTISANVTYICVSCNFSPFTSYPMSFVLIHGR